jgi:hypothetical protein
MAAPKEREKVPGLVGPSRGTREEALALIFAPLVERGNGFRHGAIGAPEYGKTYGIREVIDEALERDLVELVVTHDVKGREPEFEEGTQVAFVGDEVAVVAELEHTRHLVYRGDPMADVPCSAEAVAELARRILRAGTRVLLNVGELDECLTEGGRGWETPTVRWFSSQGRKLKGCLTWTTQQPKRTPDEIFDQSTTVAFHHLDARSANYLGNSLFLDPAMVEVLPKLTIGEFVLMVPATEWNRKVYRF